MLRASSTQVRFYSSPQRKLCLISLNLSLKHLSMCQIYMREGRPIERFEGRRAHPSLLPIFFFLRGKTTQVAFALFAITFSAGQGERSENDTTIPYTLLFSVPSLLSVSPNPSGVVEKQAETRSQILFAKKKNRFQFEEQKLYCYRMFLLIVTSFTKI